jgi:TonB family protein
MRSSCVFVAVHALCLLLGSALVAAVQDPAPQAPIQGGRVVPPRVISRVQPTMTPDAVRNRIEGVVRLRGRVEVDGTVSNVEVLQSLDRGLDEAAVNALRQWRYEPATLEGVPVRVVMTVNMTFTLGGGPGGRWPAGFTVFADADWPRERAVLDGVRLEFQRPPDWSWTTAPEGYAAHQNWIILRGPADVSLTIAKPQPAPFDLMPPIPPDRFSRLIEGIRRASVSGAATEVQMFGQVQANPDLYWVWATLRLPALPAPPGVDSSALPFSEGRAWVFTRAILETGVTVACQVLMPKELMPDAVEARARQAAGQCGAVIRSISLMPAR